MNLHRFVFTSTYASVDRRHGHVATEEDRIGSRRVTPYVRSRVQAEDLVMQYVKEHGLPAVAMCVSTTYGSGDWGRTPHGAFIAGAVFGKLPFLMDGIELEVVGVDDAARAMILAAQRGRNGEKYLISERMIPLKDVVRIAADEAGWRRRNGRFRFRCCTRWARWAACGPGSPVKTPSSAWTRCA